MTGGEDVVFSCDLDSVLMINNDVCFLTFFSCLRGCSGHGTEAQSIPLCLFSFTIYLLFRHVCNWSAEWVACSSLGQQLPLLCWMTQPTAGDDHSPVIPAGGWNAWGCRKWGCEHCFGGWSPVGSRGQSKHAPAQEKDYWSLRFFPGATATCWWTETACFLEINMNFKHIHFATSTKPQLEQHEHEKGWIPWLRKQRQRLEWEMHRFGSWEKDNSWRGRIVCLCMWA